MKFVVCHQINSITLFIFIWLVNDLFLNFFHLFWFSISVAKYVVTNFVIVVHQIWRNAINFAPVSFFQLFFQTICSRHHVFISDPQFSIGILFIWQDKKHLAMIQMKTNEKTKNIFQMKIARLRRLIFYSPVFQINANSWPLQIVLVATSIYFVWIVFLIQAIVEMWMQFSAVLFFLTLHATYEVHL